MSRHLFCLAVAVGACGSFASAASHPYVTYEFTGGSQGWQSVDMPFRAHVANPTRGTVPLDVQFGNPTAPSLRVGDLYSNTGIATPTTYAGNLAGAYDHLLLWSEFVRYADNASYPAVQVNCGTDSLYYEMNATGSIGAWSTPEVYMGLSNPGWKLASTGQAPTQRQFGELLSHVTAIYLLTEWHSGIDDTNLDYVFIPRPLYSGDINRDLKVDFSDLLTMAQNYGVIFAESNAPDFTWNYGDTNGDDAVNFTDLLGLAQNYGKSMLQEGLQAASSSFDADWALAQSMVPEPTGVAAAGLAVLAVARRRR